MNLFNSKDITVLLILGFLSIAGIIISSLILINSNGMDQRLQGWVNLLWLPLPVVTILIDRYFVKKLGSASVNKIELYIFGSLILLLLVNWIRLQFQK